MRVFSESFADGDAIPPAFALGQHDPVGRFAFAGNRNPHVGWDNLPLGTRSLVILCTDLDAPARPAPDNDTLKDGRVIAPDAPRGDFHHWVLVDFDPAGGAIGEGEFSDGVTARGKAGPASARGTRAGLNDYTHWFEGDAAMGGDYFGYDGPAPPWNDSIVHRYRFVVYATDLERCPVSGTFRAPDVLEAIKGHILDQGEFVGTYKINPEAR